MKMFKTINNLYICQECGYTCKSKRGISQHVNTYHNNKEYYDKWIKENLEGKCKICNKQTNFISIGKGYKNCCSKKCTNKYNFINREKAMFEKYGVKNASQIKEVKEKIKQTNLEKYGVDHPLKSNQIKEKIRQTNLEKYGYEHQWSNKLIIKKGIKTKIKKYNNKNYNNRDKAIKTNLKKYKTEYPLQNKEIKEKRKQSNIKKYGVPYTFQVEKIKKQIKQTNLEKYGVENPLQNKEIIEKVKQSKLNKYGNKNYNNQEKRKQTSLEKYGVEHPSQNNNIYKKIEKSSYKINTFKDTNLTYQGSYELDFLEMFYDKIDIENGPSIPYLFEGKNHVYHSDFYIPSKNLIVEIKSSYLYMRDNNIILEKEKATISNGFNYIIIIDKDYLKFKDLIFF